MRGGATPEAIAEALIDNLHYVQAKLPQHATRNDWYMALAYTVRDRMLDRYITTLETLTTADTAQGGRVPLGRVPDRAASRQQPDQPRIWGRRRAGGLDDRPATCPRSSSRRKSPASATADSAASPPATWTRWRRSTCRRSATASATSSASSTRRSATAGRSSSPTSGCASATRGRSCARKSTFDVQLRRPHRAVPRASRAHARALGAGARGQGRRLRHAGAGLPGAARRTCCGSGKPKRPSRSTSTRSTSATTTARSRRRSLGNDLQGALSERRAGGRQAAAADAAVLLRLLLAAGHDPPAPDARQDARRLRPLLGRAAERHASRRSPSPS